jgi:hypothetical protein
MKISRKKVEKLGSLRPGKRGWTDDTALNLPRDGDQYGVFSRRISGAR